MKELLSLRGYKHKHFDLENGKSAAVFHQADIHYIPVGQTTFEDVGIYFEDKGSYWEMTRASYKLYVAKDFSAPQLIRYDNRYEGANHTIYYEPHSIWWVNRYDYSIRQLFRDAQPVTGILETPTKIVYYNAFGPGFDFVVQLRKDGLRKYIRVGQLTDWGTPPSIDHWPVPIFKYTAAGLTLRADDAQDDWDENSLYESQERFTVTDLSGYKSYIQKGFVRDSSPVPETQNIKMFFERNNSVLWQAKVAPRSFLQSAVYPVYIDDSTTFGDPTYNYNQWNMGESTWSNCRDGTSSDGYETPTSPDTAARSTIIDATPDTYNTWRPLIVYDTSSIVTGATVTLAKWRFWLNAVIRTVETDRGVYLVKSAMIDPTSIASGDWDAVVHGSLNWDALSSYILHANLKTGTTSGDVNELTFTDNSWVAKGSGYTEFAFVDGHDYTNNAPTTAGGNAHSYTSLYWKDAADTYDPELYVEYTPPQITKIINKTLQVAESSLRPRVMKRIKNEVENVSEGSVRSRIMARIINESVQASEGSIKARVMVRVLSSVLNLTESSLRVLGFVRVVSESVQISEAKNYLKAMFRFGNDSVNLTEGTLRPRVMKRIKDETLNVSEGSVRARVMSRIVNSTVNLTEGIVKILTPVGAAIVKVVNEVLNISEAKNRLKAMFRFGNDTVNLSESSLRPRVMSRIVTEDENLSEGSLKARTMARVVSDDENISETNVKVRGFIRVIADALNISETKSKVFGFVRVVSESLEISEVSQKVLGFIKVVNETINLSEVNLRARIMARVVNSTFQISEGSLKARVLVRISESTVNIYETATKARNLVRLILDSLNLSESAIRVRGIIKVVSDMLNISEFVTRLKTAVDAIKILVSSIFGRVITKTSQRKDTVSAISTFDKTVEKSSQFQRVLQFESEFETEEL